MAIRTNGNIPVRKVAAGGIGGAVSIIIVYVINNFVITDPEKLLTGTVSAAIATVVSFVISYYMPPRTKESNVVA